MTTLERITRFFNRKADKITNLAQRKTIFGFSGIPVYYVLSYFFKGIYEGALTTRASGIAFSFFLSLFPAIIFFFTLIPYIPIGNFQSELLLLIKDMMPENAYKAVEETLTDIVTNQRSNLLSIVFLVALIFSTNGISAMISAFNASIHTRESRSWIAQQLVSFVLVMILAVLLTTAITLVVFNQQVLQLLVEKHWLQSNSMMHLITFGKWFIILLLFFFTISFLYFLAPAKKVRWRFFSVGATFATTLCILGSLGFSFYVNNFGQYNKLYGSIGTLIVILLWIYLNSIALLAGFELNVSILHAKRKHLQLLQKNKQKKKSAPAKA